MRAECNLNRDFFEPRSPLVKENNVLLERRIRYLVKALEAAFQDRGLKGTVVLKDTAEIVVVAEAIQRFNEARSLTKGPTPDAYAALQLFPKACIYFRKQRTKKG